MNKEFEKQLKQTLNNIYNDAVKAYQSITNYVIEIGIIDESKTNRKLKKKKKKKLKLRLMMELLMLNLCSFMKMEVN